MTRSTVHSTISQDSANRQVGNRAVGAGRILFLTFLTVVAVILGYSSYAYLHFEENLVAETQFKSIADRALDTSLEITRRKRLGTISMASILSNNFPNADAWPFVTLDAYEEISTNLIETSSGREMGFCPLVTPEQLEEFETFAYNFFERDRDPPFPNGTAISSFGKGVWGRDPTIGSPDDRYHESDGSTSYGSPYKIFAPILQHNAGGFPALMLNLHFQKERGEVIDSLIDCAKTIQETGKKIDCLSITDMIILTSQEVEPGPGALLMQPIFPRNDNTTVSFCTVMIPSSIGSVAYSKSHSNSQLL